MSRFYSYLNSAVQILKQYNGAEPFSFFLKKYFNADKKFGSKDRKQISHLSYCYFRLGKAAMFIPIEDRILTGLFLCSNEPNEMLTFLKPEWNEKVKLSLTEKLSFLNYQLSSVFPWKEELSEGIDHEEFCTSFFVQPDLFLRIRPGHAESVLLKLDKAGVEYEFISPFSIRLENNFKTDQHFELDKEVVVQDYSSQKVSEFIPVRWQLSDRVWDCCAGSGGKSIMIYDLNPEVELVVSDVRESILANLKKRFEKAGIKNYKSALLDLVEKNILHLPDRQAQYSIILADVPCTGSGTWGRTPEQLFYFDIKKIEEYASLQKKILANVVPHLEPGGHFLYITCSVFKKENEEIAAYMKQEFDLEVVKSELLKGYDKKADTMFATLLKKPL